MFAQSLAIQQMLTPEEKLAAVRGSFTDSAGGVQQLYDGLLWFGIIALGIAVSVSVYTRLRKLKWMRVHTNRLRRAGLMADEIQLFRALGSVSRAELVPRLTRSRGAFDEGAARWLRRTRPDERRAVLSSVLSLRRRIPFEREALRPKRELTKGVALSLRFRAANGEMHRLLTYVLSVRPQVLQLGVMGNGPDIGPFTGQVVSVSYLEERNPFEARVRVRGRCVGTRIQLLVDAPRSWLPSRVRMSFGSSHETVQLELLERFPVGDESDDTPTTKAHILERCPEGIVVKLSGEELKSRESVKVVDGESRGVYRTFVEFSRSKDGARYFLVGRGKSEETARGKAPRPSVQPWRKRRAVDTERVG